MNVLIARVSGVTGGRCAAMRSNNASALAIEPAAACPFKSVVKTIQFGTKPASTMASKAKYAPLMSPELM
eukprot:SAG31_NODE_5370_length_2581_cov_1.259871_2_plen_70_part_00